MKNFKIYTAFLLALLLGLNFAFSQETEEVAEPQPVPGTFSDIRLINLHTTETSGKKALGFRISHRLGLLNSGFYNFFGLDGPASVYLSLDWGITDDLMVGLGRSGHRKMYESYLKYRILKQTYSGMPISLTVYGKANYEAVKSQPDPVTGFDPYDNFAHRWSYLAQVIIARRFSERIAFMITPSFIHYNLTPSPEFANNIFSISAGGRVNITKRLGIVGEYSYVLNNAIPDAEKDNFNNAVALGVDISTGGHAFQLHLTNSFPVNEAVSIPYTKGDWLKGEMQFGFNISRTWWF